MQVMFTCEDKIMAEGPIKEGEGDGNPIIALVNRIKERMRRESSAAI